MSIRKLDMKVLIILYLFSSFFLVKSCIYRDYGNGGHVCVCSSTKCDKIPKPILLELPSLLIYTSNKIGLRFEKSNSTFIKTNQIYNNEIHINSKKKFQTIYGFGGAFTDAAGINIASLPKAAQDKLLESYFSQDGIEYSLCRVPIGGSDFSTHGYSYDDEAPDPELSKFKLAEEDYKYKIFFMKKAKNLQNELKFFASAWTAPKWMKTNNNYNGIFGFLRPDMYQSWAEYFVKFLDKYKEQGLDFWGITTGNEPSLALLPFTKINSVAWTPKQMSTWIKNNLGPTIRNSNHSNIKIMVLDDQRFFLPWFVVQLFEDKTVRDYIDGIAVHWYQDFLFSPSLLSDTKQHFPEKFLLATEACHGDKPFQKKVVLGSWSRGESYASDIIEDMQNWVSGWVDWNMVLNQKGGPTYIDNNVDSPIIVNSTSGEFYKQPMFYVLGHFSKFVPYGSVSISSSSYSKNLPVAAFLRPDNTTTVIILNKEEDTQLVTIADTLRGYTHLNLSGKSITTLIYK